MQILDANSRGELIARIPDQMARRGPYQAIVTRLSPKPFEPFDGALLSPFLPDLRIVVSAQCGYNDFDVGWMTRHGVWFCNSQSATCEATAEMALFLILAVLRNTSLAERNARRGLWRSGLGLGGDPAGLTLGVVGMGKVGALLARKAAAAFGMRIAYWNHSGRRVSGAGSLGCRADPQSGGEYERCETLDELLRRSDVVSLHCPLTESTRSLMSHDQFGIMREGSFFINTSRGALVDDDALIAALETGRVRRAGLDVFAGEPDGIHAYYRERVDKVVVQPHMGGLTGASFARAAAECFANIRRLFEVGRPVAPVNDLSYYHVTPEYNTARAIRIEDADESKLGGKSKFQRISVGGGWTPATQTSTVARV